MVKDVLSWLDYSICAEIALVLFLCIFIGVTLQALFADKKSTDKASMIPFSDAEKAHFSASHKGPEKNPKKAERSPKKRL